MKSAVCAHFREGFCRFGDSCNYIHQAAQGRSSVQPRGPPFAGYAPRGQMGGRHDANGGRHVDGRGGGHRGSGGRRRDQEKREFNDLHHQLEKQRGAVERSTSAGGTATTARAIGATANDIWTPPTEALQRIQVDSYSLFFPLELTNKDYMRRVLDIVAMGIRDRVLSITADRRLPPLNSDNDSDVYALLKQLLGGEGFQKPENAASTQTQRSVFADALGAPNVQQMSNAASYLYKMRNRLAHMEEDSSRLTLLTVMFDSARNLLECFGPSAVASKRNLENLQHQHEQHMAFKERRMHQLGWAWDDAPASDGRDAATTTPTGSTLAETISASNDALATCVALLQPAEAALTHVAKRLATY